MASLWPILTDDPQLIPQKRRFLALYLPRWATDCLKRADPALAASGRPLALWEKQKGAMRLVAMDRQASANGLFAGQSLPDARALCPIVDVHEIDRGYVEHAFAEFADWHSNASPIVSILTDHAPYGDLVLDITGVSHLFGNEARMLRTLRERLTVLGLSVEGAIASTVGAAWGLAHFNPGIVDGDVAQALASLPVAALRLDDEQTESLSRMGLKQIGQLYGRSRHTLTARFGENLIARLDQALGNIEERPVPRLPLAEHYVECRFAEPIGLMDDVMMTTRDLAFRLSSHLENGGLGAQAFLLFIYRTDHKVMTMSVNAARATRDPGHIARLFVHRAERLEGEYAPGFGIDMIRLAAGSVSPLAASQGSVFEARDGAEDLERLYDRMTSRLGPLAVVRSKFVNTHIPERAVKLEPVIARTSRDPLAMPDAKSKRPLRLLPTPEPITVVMARVPDGPPPEMVWRRVSYKFVKTVGPERIGVEWWTLPETIVAASDGSPVVNDGSDLTRDYYIAEDNGGRRFWLFRQGLYEAGVTQRWFLHGFFA